jgi:hypothetical protein
MIMGIPRFRGIPVTLEDLPFSISFYLIPDG